MTRAFVPRGLRRKLRLGLGSRSSRRNGTKSAKGRLKMKVEISVAKKKGTKVPVPPVRPRTRLNERLLKGAK